jgi:DNA-binding response OmpR family regulator
MDNSPRKRILIVEDDPLVSDVVVQALQDSYDTASAETSAAAMERLRAGGIDVMLLDCTLPDGVDPQLLQMADTAGVPVILMSGDPAMIERVSTGAARPCIQKPFRLETLLATLESVVRGQVGDSPP